jgi:hypothetical protein
MRDDAAARDSNLDAVAAAAAAAADDDDDDDATSWNP